MLAILHEMAKLQRQDAGSTPIAFDDGSRPDFRFQMELIPQHPMTLDMAVKALQIISNIVLDSEVRGFVALVVCQQIARGRFRTWLLDPESENKALP